MTIEKSNPLNVDTHVFEWIVVVVCAVNYIVRQLLRLLFVRTTFLRKRMLRSCFVSSRWIAQVSDCRSASYYCCCCCCLYRNDAVLANE